MWCSVAFDVAVRIAKQLASLLVQPNVAFLSTADLIKAAEWRSAALFGEPDFVKGPDSGDTPEHGMCQW